MEQKSRPVGGSGRKPGKGRRSASEILAVPEAAMQAPRVVFPPPAEAPFLALAGSWKGDDFEECLQAVVDSRSRFTP